MAKTENEQENMNHSASPNASGSPANNPGNSQDFFSQLLNGILILDKSGNVTAYNKTAEKLLGQPKEQVLNQPFWIHFADNILGFSLRDALKNPNYSQALRHTAQLENQNTVDLEIETSPLSLSDKGQITFEGLLITLRDARERKKADPVSERQRRMDELAELAAMIAHEIRNPLGGIKGFASLLERDLDGREDLRKMTAYIIEGTGNINDIITRVLEYAKPVNMKFEKIALCPFIEKICDQLLASEMNLKNIEIQVESKKGTIDAEIDPHSIRISITNLLFNAIQAMPSGGKVVITLDEDETHITINVSDTGNGITEENLKKIFSPFFTTRPDASGFGLSEVHKTVQAHQGSIDVFSKEGLGAAFTLKLPKTQTT